MPDIILGIPGDILDDTQVNRINQGPCPDGAYVLVRGGGEIKHNKWFIYVTFEKLIGIIGKKEVFPG